MKPLFSFKYNNEPFLCGESTATPDGNVEIQVDAKEYPEFDALYWVLNFENIKDISSGVLSDICDADILLPLDMPPKAVPGRRTVEGQACVITMNGMTKCANYWENDRLSAGEYNLCFEYLDKVPERRKCFKNYGGLSSNGILPIFDITAGGCGYIAMIGWTGNWRAEFQASDDGIRMKTGLQDTEFYLESKEKVRTSSILIMKYTANEDKYNKFRRLIKTCFSHKTCTDTDRDGLMAMELWGGLDSSEMKKRLGEMKEYGIQFEDVWLDAGWYGECEKCDDPFTGDWGENTGTWTTNSRVHPGGLVDVSEVAQDACMNLMLWFEPERAVWGTPITREHPEWFLRSEGNDSALLWYGNQEAVDYVCKTISDYISKLKLSCYRQDFNVELEPFCKENDKENRKGITEIKHICGMYKVWDYILENHPGIIIDNCSGGGRRIDLETVKRSIIFFRSDYQCNFNENSEVLQTHNSNLSKYLPYNGCTTKTKGDTYAIRSSYSSSWGAAFYNAVFQSMDDNDFKWTKSIAEEYRRIRKYMSEDFYNLGSVTFDETSWVIWQYNNPETQSGIVIAFRRCRSPFESVKINLKGMEVGGYIFENLDDGSVCEGSSELEIFLPQKRSSVIFEYKMK